MKKTHLLFAVYILVFILPYRSFCQDSLKTDGFIPKKNVIRYNLTPNLLGFSSVIFGYERVVKPYQSFSINAGYLSIGKSGSNANDEYDLTGVKSSSGFSVAADYRFYLKKVNKDPAPSGIYFAPYFLHYTLNLSAGIRKLVDNNSGAETIIDTKININSIGAELGYQFNIKNRVTVDLILVGPSISSYNINMEINGGTSPPDDPDETMEALRDFLYGKYPWLETLIDEGEVDIKGSNTNWGFGFRYVLQIGYRF